MAGFVPTIVIVAFGLSATITESPRTRYETHEECQAALEKLVGKLSYMPGAAGSIQSKRCNVR
jgi:hypothetical protein